MKSSIKSGALVRLAATSLIILCSSLAHAGDRATRIEAMQARMDTLNAAFLTSQRRIVASADANDPRLDKQLNTADRLLYAQGLLNQLDREFTVLVTESMLADLVTDERGIRSAKRILGVQEKYISRMIGTMTESVAKSLPRAGDDETSRLLLEFRDILRDSREIFPAVVQTP